MQDARQETDLEAVMRLARAGERPVSDVFAMIRESDVVILIPATEAPTAAAIDPFVVHRDESDFIAVFTALDQVPDHFASGRSAITLPARLLADGIAPGVGLVVNPGGTNAMEIPASSVALLRTSSATSPDRYFIRERVVDGESVPTALFRRRSSGSDTTDEVLVDVDRWKLDDHGTVDRAIRFPLDADLEEVSAEAAAEVLQMVAARRYTPLSRR